jgi:phosphohistidine phosphatase
VVYDDRLYDATPETLLDVFHETDEKVGTLLLVGHNPGLHEVATLLIASGDLEARQRINEDFPPAGLAVVDFALDGWGRLHPHAGRLERFISPRSLATATD